MSDFKNFGKTCEAKYVGCKIDIVAGSVTDASEVTSAEIDRKHATSLGIAQSAKLIIAWQAVLTEGKTAAIKVDMTDCATSSGSYSSDVEVLASTVVGTGGTGGTTVAGVTELDLDLSGYARYLEPKITMDLNASGTDTANWFATLVLGGYTVDPV